MHPRSDALVVGTLIPVCFVQRPHSGCRPVQAVRHVSQTSLGGTYRLDVLVWRVRRTDPPPIDHDFKVVHQTQTLSKMEENLETR